MLYSIPDYYKEFSCTADQCEDTCCAGWQIVVDRKALNRYRHVSGVFKKDLRRGINWKEGTFRQSTEKRCAFLDEDNLCRMYKNLGEKAFAEHAGYIQGISKNLKMSERSHCLCLVLKWRSFFLRRKNRFVS